MPGSDIGSPAAFGMEPVGICSACWRGWMADYALAGRQLVLDVLYINLIDRDKRPDSFERVPGPPIGGVRSPHCRVILRHPERS